MTLRRHLRLGALSAGVLLSATLAAQAADLVRIGVPTKTYWPTILVTAGIENGIFAQEGLEAEMTIYRGGAETFEAIAADSADTGVVAAPLVAIAHARGRDQARGQRRR